MPDRPRLNIVDDPVTGNTQTALRPAPAGSERRARRQATPPPAPARAEHAAPAPDDEPAPDLTPPQPASPPARYRDEQKRAVFGRVPRSLSRRLERAVVELREEMEDLTQEQVLAALLERYVEPGDPEQLGELATTVRDYRQRL
jgi:hypothetical protein